VQRQGLHVHDDHFYPEVIDPQTGASQQSVGRGELVFTTLTKVGFPLLRYRTRDLTELDSSPCACGRTSVRMRKCLARSDDMLIIRGVNLFPSQIEAVMLEIPGLAPHYRLIVDRVSNLDRLTLEVEADEHVFSDSIGQLESFTNTIRKAIESAIGLGIEVKLVEPRSIERSEGKARRVIDNRKLQ
jgi:phenylacetate-CoA ligase